MDEELFPAGARVIEKRGYDVGTSKGRNQIQSMYYNSPAILVEFDNGRRDVIPEIYLREATEEDEARSAERIRHTEEVNRRAEEKAERKRQRQEENEETKRQAKEAEAEAKEEAKRREQEEYTAEMRKANARYYGLESLRRPDNETGRAEQAAGRAQTRRPGRYGKRIK